MNWMNILAYCDTLILGISNNTKRGETTRRESTVVRNNEIHDMYDSIINRLGDLAGVVSRSYVYGEIRNKTRLSIRQIQRILNHTKKEDIF